MKTRFSARVDSKLLAESKKYYTGSTNTLLELALEEFIQNHTPDIEKLNNRKFQLEEELIQINAELENANKKIIMDENLKKGNVAPENAETPLDNVKASILRQLKNHPIKKIVETAYIKAYCKRLNWTEDQVIQLIISLATEEQVREYGATVAPKSSLIQSSVSK